MTRWFAASGASAPGAALFCWSTAGASDARATAEELGLRDCFEAFLPKPHILLDDVELGRWNGAESLTAAELLKTATRRS